MNGNNQKDNFKERTVNLLRTGNLQDAKKSGIELCRAHSGDPQSWMILAEIHARLNELAEAEQCYAKTVDLKPGPPAIHIAQLNRGIVLLKLGRTEDAVQCLRGAVQLKPDFFEAHVHLGDALMVLQDPAQACNTYQDAVNLRPGLPAIHTRLAAAMRACGNLHEAEQCAQAALKVDPNNLHAVLELGHINADLNQYAEAIVYFRNAARIDSRCKEAWLLIGNIEFHRGDTEAAADSYQKFLEISPGDEQIRLLTARILTSTGALDRAEDICFAGLEKDPGNTRLMIELGKCLSEHGKTKEANQWFTRASELEPDLLEAAYLISEHRDGDTAHLARQGYIRELFDGYAGSFDTHLTKKLEYNIPVLLWEIFQKFTGHELNHLDALDLGCGSGLCGQYFRGITRKLTGVDLSPKMIMAAREKGIYDELHVADIFDFLEHSQDSFDLIIAADVFIYCGDLSRIFRDCNRILRDKGLFTFSAESIESGSFVLRSSGRFGHSREYIQALAEENGLEIVAAPATVIRKEANKPIAGFIVLAKKR